MNSIWLWLLSNWPWLLVGVLPYHLRKRQGKQGYTIEVRAFFWSLIIVIQPEQRKKQRHYDMTLQIPLLRRLRK
jgi:hypothetical protein